MKNIEENKGIVFDIKRFSTEDGPGIRTTVFLKGCPLKCIWCHSPESIYFKPELAFYENKCIKCGYCVKICPTGVQELIHKKRIVHWGECNNCGKCTEICPSLALRMIGKAVTIEDIYKEVKKDNSFYRNSKGGVTLSGGEPTLQINFIEGLLKICKEEGISTCLDTSGYVSWSSLEKIVDQVDLFLYDIKHMNEKEHFRLAGVSNRLILQNLKKLKEKGKEIIIRVPLVPGYNTSAENLQNLLDYLLSLSIKRVDFLPYNKASGGKYVRIGKNYSLESVEPYPQGKMRNLLKDFTNAGIDARVVR